MAAAFAPDSTTEFFPAGETCTEASIGDLVLVRHSGLVARLIRFGQRIRRMGVYGWCNHAAIVISVTGPDGSAKLIDIVEATAKGVVVTPLEGYTHELYAVVHPEVTDQELANVAAYAVGSEGDKYGWVTIAGEVLYILTGIPLVLGWGRSVICSGDAATALVAARLRPDRALQMVMPANLAEYFGVAPG